VRKKVREKNRVLELLACQEFWVFPMYEKIEWVGEELHIYNSGRLFFSDILIEMDKRIVISVCALRQLGERSAGLSG